MRSSIRSILICGLSASLWTLPLSAQRTGPSRRGQAPDRAQLEQRVRAQMGRMMRERLGLDEDQAARLSEVVQGFEGQRQELLTREQATRRRVEALLLEGGNDQEEARELLGRMSALRVQEAELFRSEQEALLDVLTPAQVLRLQALRQDLGRRIRALRGGPGPDAGARRRLGAPGTGRMGAPGPRGRTPMRAPPPR